MVKILNLCIDSVYSIDMATLPPRAQRYPWLRYQVNRVHVLDFAGLTDQMRGNLADRLRMVYTGDEGQELFTSHAWRRLFEIRGPLVRELILEFFSTCRMSDTEMGLHTAEEMAEDGFEAYWHAEGRKSGARMSGGNFIGHLADHFGIVSDEGLMGLSVITRVLTVIDLHELAKLNICVRLGDTWAWVALGPKRQQVAEAGAPEVVEGALVVFEGVPAPVQAPQPPPTAASARTIAQRFTTWTVTSLSRMMDQNGVRYTSYSDFQIPYQRRTRRRTGDANSLASPHVADQPDP
ncbi:hypothetical protein Tco_0337294 [Tanacetum coccineum]